MNILFIVAYLFFPKVFSACNLIGRIQRNDSEVSVSHTSCTLTLTAMNNKQVVAVLYDVFAGCIIRSTVAIYDGNSTDGKLLSNNCTAYPLSYASRSHSLTMTAVGGKPLREFSLDIYTIDDDYMFANTTGIIKSERFTGFILSGIQNTTPNNFHVKYRIRTIEPVTILLTFTEFQVHSSHEQSCDTDFVQIATRAVGRRFCGYKALPLPISIVTDELIIEFQTDEHYTYSGFTANFHACLKESDDTNGTIHFPEGALKDVDNLICAYVIYVTGNMKVDFRIEFTERTGCLNIQKVLVDSIDVSDKILRDCRENLGYSWSVVASHNVSIHLSLAKGQSLDGIFSTDNSTIDSERNSYTTYSSTGNFNVKNNDTHPSLAENHSGTNTYTSISYTHLSNTGIDNEINTYTTKTYNPSFNTGIDRGTTNYTPQSHAGNDATTNDIDGQSNVFSTDKHPTRTVENHNKIPVTAMIASLITVSAVVFLVVFAVILHMRRKVYCNCHKWNQTTDETSLERVVDKPCRQPERKDHNRNTNPESHEEEIVYENDFGFYYKIEKLGENDRSEIYSASYKDYIPPPTSMVVNRPA